MPRTASRRAWAGPVSAVLLLAAGCGAEEPPPLKAMPPDAPADLCSTLPTATKAGLQTASNSDTQGTPTAACSLRSATGATPAVRAVVTWLQLDDETSAADVYASQCRSIDRTEFREQSGYTAKGADQACAGAGRVGGADSVTIAGLGGRAVVTVRLSSLPPGSQPMLTRGAQMLEGVLSSLAGGS